MASSMVVGQKASSLWGVKPLATPARKGARSTSRAAAPRAEAKSNDKLPATLLGLAGLMASASARAEDGASVDSAIDTVIGAVKATGDAVKAGVEAVNTGVEYAKDVYDQVAPVVGPVVKQAADATLTGAKVAAELAAPAIKAVEPSLQASLVEAQKAIAPAVTAAKPVVQSTEVAVKTAKPAVDTAVTFLTTTDPVTLGEYALGLVALYYLAPPLAKVGVGALRGYAGEVTPAAALDTLAGQGNTLLVDIRTSREKEQAGIPDLPNNGKLVELEYVSVSDRKLRGQLRNPGDLELNVTAMQIAALKRLSKSSTLYILDRNGGVAKAVAKELAKRGFSKTFVIAGGFSAWTNSKLKVKPSSTVSSVEVIAPGTGWFGSGSTRSASVTVRGNGVTTRKALPAPGAR